MNTESQELTLQKPDPKQMVLTDEGGFNLRTLDEIWQFASILSKSALCPKGDSKEDIVIKLVMGDELKVSPMQAIQNIAVINGKPSIYGDLLPALVEKSKLLEWDKVEEIGDPGQDSYGYRVSSKRKGRDPKSAVFTVGMAKKAKLWGKSGPWSDYPQRMLFQRARAFNFRDNFPDVLKGLHVVEEERDVQDAEYEVVEDKRTETEKLADTVNKQVGIEIDPTPEPEDESTSEPEPAPEPVKPARKYKKSAPATGDAFGKPSADGELFAEDGE